jgi:hypothetical protein
MTLRPDDLATNISDVAHEIEEKQSYLESTPEWMSKVATEDPWKPLGRLVYGLFEQGAFQVHAPDLHVEIRRALVRNIGLPSDDIALAAWDECVIYFASTAGLTIPSGLSPGVAGHYPKKRWLPAMPAVGVGLRELVAKISASTGNEDDVDFRDTTDVKNGLSDDQATFARGLSVYTGGASDERFKTVETVLQDDSLTANEKLTKLNEALPIPPNSSARTLGNALGVTSSAIKKTDWWRENRKGMKDEKIAHREEAHRQRAKQVERNQRDDDYC